MFKVNIHVMEMKKNGIESVGHRCVVFDDLGTLDEAVLHIRREFTEYSSQLDTSNAIGYHREIILEMMNEIINPTSVITRGISILDEDGKLFQRAIVLTAVSGKHAR